MFKPNLFVHSFFITCVLLCLILFQLPSLQAQPTIERECRLSEYDPSGHAIWLNQIPGDPSWQYVFTGQGGTATFFSDNTVQITGRIANKADTSRQWDVFISLINQMNYFQWVGTGGRLKNGGGASQTDQQDWLFFELDSTNSFLTGVPGTTFAGDTLNLQHKPASLAYGFQLGIGANDKNLSLGISGWFFFTGSYEGYGDINAIISCDSDSVPPPPVCDVVLDTFYAACKTDSTFELMVTFSGSGSNYRITDDQGSTPATGLAPGTYAYGEYYNSTDVVITVSDPNFPNCEDASLPVTQDCTPVPMCDLVVDTVFTQCTSDSTFTVGISFQGTGAHFQIFDDQGTPTLMDISAGTYTYGNYHQDSAIKVTVLDFAIFNCYSILGPLTDSCTADSSNGTMVAGFQAQSISGGVYLDWHTLQEQQNEGFTVERSTDGAVYDPIGWVTGALNSERKITYDFLDREAISGVTYYYRLKLLRTDGHLSFSKVQKITFGQEFRIAIKPVAPNPVRDNATLVAIASEDNLPLSCQLVDGLGRVLSENNMILRQGRQEINIDCSKIQTGLYFLKFSVEREIINTQRILVYE